MTQITVDLGERSYPIFIGEGTLDRLSNVLAGLKVRGTAAVVTDSNVAPLYGDRVVERVREAGLRTALCVMPAGEEHKRLERIEELTGQFLEAGVDRAGGVIALGGGVVGDVAGFAAAVFMRGIPFVQIPTTIVAQVDSSVGGKTGVNHPRGKNIIGSFHQPSAVVIDLTLLRSLPDRELRAGLAEVIKHGIIADEDLFRYMEERVDAVRAGDPAALEVPVRRSCEIKAAVVAADEREHGVRANLNYGHTFGHGIEAAGILALELGLVDSAFVARQKACIEAYGLPTAWPEIPIDATLEAMKHDKKARAGTLKFVVADRLGRVVHRTDVTEDQARRALEALKG